jgi:hypothetical protein
MMADSSTRPVKELVQQAIEVASEVPEQFKVAVFSKVFEFFAMESRVRPTISDLDRADEPTDKSANHESPKKSRSSTGPKGMAAQLVEAGFFDEARTVEAVAEHINLNFARTFASKDLSKGLIRLVQDGRLRREKSEEGRLSYKRA